MNELLPHSRISARWIVSARDDLTWFIGPVLLCYALVAVYVTRALPFVPILAALLLLDASHIFATFTRTYFDREERTVRWRLLAGVLVFLVIGPLVVFAGGYIPYFFLATVWALYHQLKQHYGFAVIYKIKNGDTEEVDNFLDRAFLLANFLGPLFVFVTRRSGFLARADGRLKLLAGYAGYALLVVMAVVSLVWLIRQVVRFSRGGLIDLPKYLLFVAVVPLMWVVMLSPFPYKLPMVVLMMLPMHTLQYHRLVWFHNRKYSSPTATRTRHGLAVIVNRRLITYAAVVIGYAVVFNLSRRGVIAAFGESSIITQTVLALSIGPLLAHFYLDSVIWRVRRNPEVGRALNVNGPVDISEAATV